MADYFNKEFLQKLRAHGPKLLAMLLLGIIFYVGFYMRSAGNQPDRLLSFDPIFQYRFTRLFAENGVLPAWDELSYYTGRAVVGYPPLIFWLTSMLWWILKGLGYSLSLMTTASFAAAAYGAAAAVPAFFFARSISNKWGGLLAATLVVTAPQILDRTFGASFDTDQFAILFIILTFWLGFEALKRRTVASFAAAVGGFTVFMLAWHIYWFTFITLIAVAVVYSVTVFAGRFRRKPPAGPAAAPKLRSVFAVLAGLALSTFAIATALGRDPLTSLAGLLGFAGSAERWIVNVSIAELQQVDLLNFDTWLVTFGRFITGEPVIDNIFFLAVIGFLVAGLAGTWKRGRLEFAFLAATIIFGILSVTRGIRFTEFSAALLLIGVGAGWGHLLSATSNRTFPKIFVMGLGFFLAFTAISMGAQMGQHRGPDTGPGWDNWNSAWEFLKATPESSLVGTWWDPGHMITGLGERRVIADGAHCGNDCLYTINDRITDLGKIFDTESEEEALMLLRKYKGTSEKIYWIASDDLVGKFQWLQFFGTGCDRRVDAKCQLYGLFGLKDAKQTSDGSLAVLYYDQILVVQPRTGVPIAMVVEGRSAAPVSEIFAPAANGTVPIIYDAMGNETFQAALNALNLRDSGQILQLTIAIPEGAQYITIIPKSLRNSMFTRLFWLGGEGLQNFRQVFSNSQVKIYEVDF